MDAALVMLQFNRTHTWINQPEPSLCPRCNHAFTAKYLFYWVETIEIRYPFAIEECPHCPPRSGAMK